MSGAPLIRFAFGDYTDADGNKTMAEFKAGRLGVENNIFNYDNRKGFLYLYQSDNWMIHLCWRERNTKVAELNLIVYKDECVFVKVEKCTSARVFVLKNSTSLKKLYFWMQEPRTDNDDAWCKRINDLINNPPEMAIPGPIPTAIEEVEHIIQRITLKENIEFMNEHTILPPPDMWLTKDYDVLEAKVMEMFSLHQFVAFHKRRCVELYRFRRDLILRPDGSYDNNKILSIIDEEPTSEDEESAIPSPSLTPRAESPLIKEPDQLDSVKPNIGNEG